MSFNKNLLCNRKTATATLNFEELVKRRLTVAVFEISFSELAEEKLRVNWAAFWEIAEHKVVGRKEGLRTMGVRQEQVQFFACRSFTKQMV